MFILANWIGVSFVNSEDRTQQFLTRLHVKNETTYHMSKIISIAIFMIPIYTITIFVPIVAGMFVRDILFNEIIAYFIVHFLISLLGLLVGVFFNSNLFSQEFGISSHLLVICICVIPFNVIFYDNLFIVYAYYFIPPISFLAYRLHNLDNGYFLFDLHFFIFVANAIIYSIILIVLYNVIMRYKTKAQ